MSPVPCPCSQAAVSGPWLWVVHCRAVDTCGIPDVTTPWKMDLCLLWLLNRCCVKIHPETLSEHRDLLFLLIQWICNLSVSSWSFLQSLMSQQSPGSSAGAGGPARPQSDVWPLALAVPGSLPPLPTGQLGFF